MTRTSWAVKIYGAPAPKGSLKCVGRGNRHQLVEDNQRGKPWRELVKAGGQALGLVSPLTGPIGIECTFTVELPASVKPAKRLWPWKKSAGIGGDVDKLARLVLDGLEDAAVLGNDAQVVDLHAVKAYPHTPIADVLDQPGAVLRVWLIDPEGIHK